MQYIIPYISSTAAVKSYVLDAFRSCWAVRTVIFVSQLATGVPNKTYFKTIALSVATEHKYNFFHIGTYK